MKVFIRFKPFFKEPMLSGVKVCTSRTKKKGEVGDTFDAFGEEFEIDMVALVPLEAVALLWKEEGCRSAEHFKEVWSAIHQVKPWDDNTMVYMHGFRKVTR